ncbi:MAG: hypothetical protein KKA81_08190 [Bacteroidetes bacterium]|nr:hypothetical protein [Bacteroidota bacterium]
MKAISLLVFLVVLLTSCKKEQTPQFRYDNQDTASVILAIGSSHPDNFYPVSSVNLTGKRITSYADIEPGYYDIGYALKIKYGDHRDWEPCEFGYEIAKNRKYTICYRNPDGLQHTGVIWILIEEE